jgi:thioredoxin reductase
VGTVGLSAIPLERADVVVVGGGPAGLAAATELARAGAGRVVVLDREAEAGGIPRHARHQGFGVRDLRRVLDGPHYARRHVELAAAAGAQIRAGIQATGWAGERTLELTGPDGRRRLEAAAIVLATGCRERPRSARLVAGTRPQGVMTTGMLQQLVYLAGERPGRRAVVVGAEHVSFSALLTLAHGGAETVAMTTELPHHQTFAALRAGAAVRFRVPLRTRTAVRAIRGRRRVEAVEVTDLDSGAVDTIPCDTVVFTGDWIPDHELAVLAGARLDPGTRGPAVDAALRTTRPGVFAAGNVLHGAEPADVAALSGRHVARSVVRQLGGAPWPAAPVPILCDPPLQWVAPNAVSPGQGAVARDRFLLRAAEELIHPLIAITQGERALLRRHLPRLVPGRSGRLPTDWAASVDPDGGPVRIRVRATRRRAG